MKLRSRLRSLQSRLPRGRRGPIVLAYHLVNGGTDSAVDLPLETFITHLELLTQGYEVVPLSSFDPNGSPRQVVLTFDDAYANFHDVIWPLLKQYDLPSTLYVPVDFIDGGVAPIRGTAAQPCTWAQLTVLARAGVELGSHTCSHADVATLQGEALQHEVVQSKLLIEERTGAVVTSFCYPRGLTHPRVTTLVDSTYANATVGGGRRVTRGTGHLPRTSVRRDHTLSDLHAILDSRVWLEEALADWVRQVRR